ncbi:MULTISPECIES: transglutaminase domain-containing protein [unclassified Exiguobacterium]|uniref:transglutaminase domain-containing protein n=1 Tax=unclassified Exiguobacterium TaxID=2644629 RepID=UPI001BE8B8B8|nr:MULTISPECIES: transglutaminase domain-containing protein [unclassified Exiguobacterium]
MSRRLIWNLLAALLLASFMPPLLELTTFDSIVPFLPLLLTPLLLSHVRRRWFLSGSLLALMVSFYFILTPGEAPWRLLGEITDDVSRVINGELPGRPAFALSIGLISFLIGYLGRRTFPNRGFVVGLTVGVIGFIAYCDTWTDYSGDQFILYPILLALLLLYATEINERPTASYVRPISALLIIGVTIVAALQSPVITATWQNSWYDWTSRFEGEGTSTNAIQKVGYGSNDEQLGGPFQMDDREVFQVESEGNRYWRVETKDVYTGKGWILSESSPEINGRGFFSHFGDDVETREESATFKLARELPFVPYNGDNVRLTADDQRQNLLINPENQKISYLDDATRQQNYQIQYAYPLFTEKLLQTDEPVKLSEMEQDRYLQLPGTLPDRVRDLAAEIVADEETPWERAKAIENYFEQENFEYNTEDVAVPAEDQDYVDQFLFETKLGYCDNFSTSATVLLRAAGLPARWVKGFTGGESDVIGSAVTSYTVRNKNAHSWVEVYIEGPGWVPLEPTVSFDGTGQYTINQETDNETEQSNPQRDTETDTETATPNRPQENLLDDAQATTANQAEKRSIPVWPIIGALLGLVFLYLFRKPIRRTAAILFFRSQIKRPEGFKRMYRFLLRRLDKQGFHYKDGRTLAELAHEVDGYYETYAMRPLTDAYERMIYGGETLSLEKKREYFENMIRRVEG